MILLRHGAASVAFGCAVLPLTAPLRVQGGSSGGRRAHRPQRDEWPLADELPDRRVRAQVVPAEDQRFHAQPPWMSPSVLDRHGEGLMLGQEALLRA